MDTHRTVHSSVNSLRFDSNLLQLVLQRIRRQYSVAFVRCSAIVDPLIQRKEKEKKRKRSIEMTRANAAFPGGYKIGLQDVPH